MLVTSFYFAVERNARKYYFLKRLDTNRSSNNDLKRNNNDSNFRESNRSRYLPFVVFNSDDRVGESKQNATRPKTSRLCGKFKGRRSTNLADYVCIYINDVHIGMAYVIFKPSARDYVPLLCTRPGRVLSLSTATLYSRRNHLN